MFFFDRDLFKIWHLIFHTFFETFKINSKTFLHINLKIIRAMKFIYGLVIDYWPEIVNGKEQ